MERRIESRFQVNAKIRVIVPGHPARILDCDMVDISATGIRFLANEMVAEGILAVEFDLRLILAEIRYCQPRGMRFVVGARRLHEIEKNAELTDPVALVREMISDLRQHISAGTEPDSKILAIRALESIMERDGIRSVDIPSPEATNLAAPPVEPQQEYIEPVRAEVPGTPVEESILAAETVLSSAEEVEESVPEVSEAAAEYSEPVQEETSEPEALSIEEEAVEPVAAEDLETTEIAVEAEPVSQSVEESIVEEPAEPEVSEVPEPVAAEYFEPLPEETVQESAIQATADPEVSEVPEAEPIASEYFEAVPEETAEEPAAETLVEPEVSEVHEKPVAAEHFASVEAEAIEEPAVETHEAEPIHAEISAQEPVAEALDQHDELESALAHYFDPAHAPVQEQAEPEIASVEESPLEMPQEPDELEIALAEYFEPVRAEISPATPVAALTEEPVVETASVSAEAAETPALGIHAVPEASEPESLVATEPTKPLDLLESIRQSEAMKTAEAPAASSRKSMRIPMAIAAGLVLALAGAYLMIGRRSEASPHVSVAPVSTPPAEKPEAPSVPEPAAAAPKPEPAAKAEPAKAAPAAKTAHSHHVEMKITAMNWISVSNDGGHQFQATLHQGESHSLDFSKQATLWVGNGSAVQIAVDGKPIQQLKAGPAVLLVTPEGIKFQKVPSAH